MKFFERITKWLNDLPDHPSNIAARGQLDAQQLKEAVENGNIPYEPLVAMVDSWFSFRFSFRWKWALKRAWWLGCTAVFVNFLSNRNTSHPVGVAVMLLIILITIFPFAYLLSFMFLTVPPKNKNGK